MMGKLSCVSLHLQNNDRNNQYENTPIQTYWKFYQQKMKIFG